MTRLLRTCVSGDTARAQHATAANTGPTVDLVDRDLSEACASCWWRLLAYPTAAVQRGRKTSNRISVEAAASSGRSQTTRQKGC